MTENIVKPAVRKADPVEKLRQEALETYSAAQNCYHMAMPGVAGKLMDNFITQIGELARAGVDIGPEIDRIRDEAGKTVAEYRAAYK